MYTSSLGYNSKMAVVACASCQWFANSLRAEVSKLYLTRPHNIDTIHPTITQLLGFIISLKTKTSSEVIRDGCHILTLHIRSAIIFHSTIKIEQAAYKCFLTSSCSSIFFSEYPQECFNSFPFSINSCFFNMSTVIRTNFGF